ncbi:hypothetical protein NC652_027602 [Populus alba x Populus x berolinensis]|nr:hypothetical protein NC652_027602 [Populus alba x Populus x berolinensis]
MDFLKLSLCLLFVLLSFLLSEIRSLDPSIVWRNQQFELEVGVKFTVSGWEIQARLKPGRADPQPETNESWRT